MKMVVISADEYEKLKNEKGESATKIESYKQCIAGYESRIKELTEELDELKCKYRDTIAKKVLNSAYGTEQDVCCRISNGLNVSMFDKITELSNENRKLEAKVSSLRTQLKDINYAFNEKEKLISVLKNDNYMRGQIIEGDAKKIKELRQKYEAVLKTNEKLAVENQRLANDPETIKLNNELTALKKQYRDINNAYKSQKNALYKLTKSSDDAYDVLRSQYNFLHKDYERVILLREEAIKEIKSLNTRLSQVATKVAKIYNNTKADTCTLDTLVEDLKAYI